MVSYAILLYHQVLGDQDSSTGQFIRGYTSLSATMIIYPPGAGYTVSGVGVYAGKNSVGVTNCEIDEGDVVQDSFGKLYRVISVRAHTQGDSFLFNLCDLKEVLMLDWRVPSSGTSPVSDPNFFGFESITTGEEEFEAGFERGYFTS